MTLETKEAIVNTLKQRGVPASLEYPEFIMVSLKDGEYLACGDANDNFCIDHCTAHGDLIGEPAEFDIPSTTDDVKLVVTEICGRYTEATTTIGNRW